MSRRLSVPAAFARLLLHFNGWVAADMLNAGLRRNHVRLYRDGALVSPAEIIDAGLYVRAEVEADGRWCCSIEAPRAAMRVAVISADEDTVRVRLPPEPLWEVEADDVTALLPTPPPPRGRKRGEWAEEITRHLERIGLNRARELEISRALSSNCVGALRDKNIEPPKDPKAIRRVIRAFLDAGERGEIPG